MIRSIPHPLLVLLLLAAVTACGDPTRPGEDTTGGGGITPPEALPVLGHGVATPGPYTAEVAVAGSRAYTTTYASSSIHRGNIVNIWDVSGNAPVLVDTLVIPGSVARTSDISIADDASLMVVSTEPAGTLAIFELAGTTKPRLIVNWPVPGVGSPGIHTAKLARVGGTLYAFAQGTSPAQGVHIIDLSVPAAPVVRGRIAAANYIHDVFVRDGIAFAADWDAGVAIWDLGGGGAGGTVAAPVLIGRAATRGGNAHNVWWFHDPSAGAAVQKRYIIVGEEQSGIIGSSSAGDLHVVDISTVGAPQEVAVYHVDGAGTHNVSVDEARGILYAAYYNGGVRALDIRGDLSVCTAAQRTAAGLCDLQKMGREKAVGLATGTYVWGVQFAGGAVYASDMLSGIWKLQPVVR